LYRKKTKINERDKALLPVIKQVMDENPSYGHRRIAIAIKVNKKRILRIMKKFNLKPAKRRPRRPIKLNDLNSPVTIYKNLIKNICPIVPHIIWSSDFTYIPFKDNFVYLACVTDVFTRMIVGWSISVKHTSDFVLEALQDAVERTNKAPQILHSDQGSEYTSQEYISFAQKKEIKISMSRKSSPWENGYQESFFATFKLELGDPESFKTLGELTEAIHLTINYYNRNRIHSKLKMSPYQYYLNYLKKFNLESLFQIWGT
jgi:transposase InsO family protein